MLEMANLRLLPSKKYLIHYHPKRIQCARDRKVGHYITNPKNA